MCFTPALSRSCTSASLVELHAMMAHHDRVFETSAWCGGDVENDKPASWRLGHHLTLAEKAIAGARHQN